MDMNLLHDVTFYVMYAAMAIAIFIAIERGIYFAYVRRQARALIDALGANVHSERDLPENLTRRDSLPLNMILPVLAQKATHGSRKDLDDEIDTQYLKTRAPLARSLWIIETITTAAPLLGLLGTVIGMIEIFGSQGGGAGGATGGNPAQLAHGISIALYNTAFGLMVASPALIFWRYFRARVDGYLLSMELAAERFVRHLNTLRK